MTKCCKNVYDQHINNTDYNEEDGIIFMITAGRNGLSPTFVSWIKSLKNVDSIIYSSCNQKITFRELQWFLNGNDGFIIEDYYILNMHPSTKYFTFFAYLKKKSRCNKTLIIPVGHFKSGKTYFIQNHLMKQLSSDDNNDIVHFHRDDIFFRYKSNGLSLKKSEAIYSCGING